MADPLHFLGGFVLLSELSGKYAFSRSESQEEQVNCTVIKGGSVFWMWKVRSVDVYVAVDRTYGTIRYY